MIKIITSNILLAITLSIDALGIGIAYGLKDVKIQLVAKGIILLVSFIFASLAITMGGYITNLFSPVVSKTVGVVTLFAIGIYTALGDPFSYDIDNSSKIDPKEALIMGFALSIDSIGVGIGSSVAGFASNFLPVAISVFQFVFLFVGQIIGNSLVKHTHIKSRLWTLLSGAIIIAIAVLRAFN